jgi:hypothetical protein
MNEDTIELEANEEVVEVESIPSELDTLKARATQMGIKFHPNTGVDKLRAKIDNKINPTKAEPKASKGKKTEKVTYLTHEEFLTEQSKNIKKSINSLVRIRVTCMNPNKKNWEGEIISVGSAKLGTFKKYVPFNADDGWHVPNIIFEAMKERKYSSFTTVRGPRGEKIRKAKLVPEFSIEVLPHLTNEELKELARRQAAQGTQA